ncbi:MAG TPA: phosphatase PAP2 family protein [Ktedonobacteraceae bacterium]|nr:phosphatase PAP2 family protein [Ktedonobacteraceae bacterium]
MKSIIPGIQAEAIRQEPVEVLKSIGSEVRTSNLVFGKTDALVVALASLQLTLLGLLAAWVRKHLVSVQDLRITHILQKKDSRFLHYAALICSYISSPKIMMPIQVPVSLFFWKKHLRLAVVVFAANSFLNEIIKLTIKHFVGRPRPNPALVRVYKRAGGKSFPSGNVASSVTFWGWLFALGLLHLKGRAQKIVLAVPAVIIILVGPSRVYLGDHWVSDVLGGYLLGGSGLALALRAYLKLRKP